MAYLCLQATTQGQASYAHVHEIVDGLQALGAHVDLFEPAYVGKSSPGALGRLREFIRVQRRLNKVLDRYDVLYVRGHALAKFSSDKAKRLGIPVIQECNGMVDDFFIAWPSSRAFSPLIVSWTLRQFKEASAIIAGSQGLASWIKREADRDAFIVPNGANIDDFSPIPRGKWPQKTLELGLPETYALFFGSLAPWQGIPSILTAAALPQWPDGVALVIVGDGKEVEAVRESARANPRVKYLGPLPYDDLSPVISGALCSLVIKEQPEFAQAGISPLKLYESLACGTPVIGTTAMPGLTEVIEERNVGITVPQYDPAAIANAVAMLNSEPAAVAALRTRARTFAEQDGSWEMRSRATGKVLLEILGK